MSAGGTADGQGYRILGSTINDIFNISEDNNEWYSDGNNIRGILTHHDASHYVLYRVAKDRETADVSQNRYITLR